MTFFFHFTALKQLKVWQKLFSRKNIVYSMWASFLVLYICHEEEETTLKQLLNSFRESFDSLKNALSFCQQNRFFTTAAPPKASRIFSVCLHCESMWISPLVKRTRKPSTFCHFLQTFSMGLLCETRIT